MSHHPSLTFNSAQSTEFDENTPNPVIIFMPEVSRTHMGGTMRLGLRPTVFEPETEGWSKIRKLYGGAPKIWERHRHRYEVNPEYVEKLVASGLPFVGKDEKGERMQVLELKSLFLRKLAEPILICVVIGHPFFVGLQAHPEFCTRPLNPSPAFLGFVAAACVPSVLEEQLEEQVRTFRPPHPEDAMVSEDELRSNTQEHVLGTGGL
jgi:CTP synthase